MLDVAPFVYFIRMVPPLMLAWLAWIIARAPMQEQANRVFSLFLGVLVLGHLFEFAWLTYRLEDGAVAPVARQVQELLGVLDPPILLAAVLLYTDRRDLLRNGALWVGYLVAALFLAVETSPLAVLRAPNLVPILQVVYVNGTYLVAFLLLLRAYQREERHFRAVQAYYLAIGVGFAALSRSGAPFTLGLVPALTITDPSLRFLASVLLAGLLFFLAWLWVGLGARRRTAHHAPRRLLAVTGLLVAVFLLLQWVAGLGSGTIIGRQLYEGYYPLRWLVFVLVVGYGILRYQLFDFDLRVRQTLALGIAVVTGVSAGMLVGALLHTGPMESGLELPTARLVGLLAGAAVTLPVWWGLAVLLRRLWPESDSVVAYRRRRLEIYQATLETAFAKPEWGPEERRFIETLRDVFEVSEEEHRAVVERLRQAAGTPR